MTRLTQHNPLSVEPISDLFHGFMRPMVRWGEAEAPRMDVDVVENNDVYTLRAEIPAGIKKEDINIEIEGNIVSISAKKERKDEQKEGERIVRLERSWGEVHRSVALASPIDMDRAQAKFDEGVLTLTLPKKQGHASQRITVS